MALFDAHASGYDAWYDTELGRYADAVEKGLIDELADPSPGERALDIGCGTGTHTIWLAEKGLVVTGLDESRAMLDVAAAKTEGTDLSVEWVLGDACALPFDEGGFDVVISVASVEFVDQPAAMLREAMRVLRVGGRLVLGLLARDSPWSDRYLREVEERPDSVFANAHFYAEEDLGSLLAAPYTLRKGLYHPPDPHLDLKTAERLEKEKQEMQEDRAGFFAVRWTKEET